MLDKIVFELADEVKRLQRKVDLMEKVPEFQFALREDLEDTGDLFLPKRATTGSVGFDVRAAQKDRKDLVLRAGQYFKIPLGFRCFCPEGWWYELHPRSSSFMKKYMHNLIGIIDEDFFYDVNVIGQYIPDISSLSNDLVVKFGDPIAQIIPVNKQLFNTKLISNEEYDIVSKKRSTNRVGGTGSTG